MNLTSRLNAALDRGVNADVFERCAVELMASIYDNVEPVEGGSDGGRDADIYGPIADDPDSRGRILVTTGDLLDNLKSSHATWKKTWAAGETFRVDQLVMVTQASVSDAKRRNIQRYCSEQELPVPQFWTRDWLVAALRKNPELRVELTGVAGRLEAVTAIRPAAPDAPALIGRVDEARTIRDSLHRDGDMTFVGLPGVGKSRLLAELAGVAHIAEPLAKDYLADDLLALEPTVVLLDDAHLQLSLLEEMVRLRAREQLNFKIIAVTWPGAESSVESFLREPSRLGLDRLPRAEMDELIRGFGISSHHARQLILDQSDGRPGWASVLAKLLVDGEGELLTSGQYLLDQAAGLTRQIAGTATLNDALACIAALGETSMRDLELVANLTEVPYADLVLWLEATAQGGIVARTGECWTVFPAMQQLMVAAWFFGNKKTRRWDTLTTRFPDDLRLTQTLLQIADLVPDREAVVLADEWFASAQTVETMDAGTLSLVAHYAQLGERSADRAAVVARRVLGADREFETTIFGTTIDPVGDAAKEVLRFGFRRTCSREAMAGLLDLALVDGRPRHSNPDHPMRVIQELAHYLDPDVGPVSELRERILIYALDWFDQGPHAARWLILTEVSSHVFDPHVEGTWLDPGSRRSFTYARGLEKTEVLRKLIQLWSKVDARIRGEAVSTIPHYSVAHLCEVFRVWSVIASGGDEGDDQDLEGHASAALEGLVVIYSTLESLAGEFPAVPINVNRQLERCRRWSDGRIVLNDLPIIDSRFTRFVGLRDFDDEMEDWMERRRHEQDSLAAELAALDPSEGVAEFGRLISETHALDGHYGGEYVAEVIASQAEQVIPWLEGAIREGLLTLVGPLIARARGRGAEMEDLVSEALTYPHLRAVVIRAFVTAPHEVDELTAKVLADLHEGDAKLIGNIWAPEEATPVLRSLLTHPIAEVAAIAAVAFGEGLRHGPSVPLEIRNDWYAALLRAHPDDLPDHSQWRLEQVLSHLLGVDPAFCADWFIANAEWSSDLIGLRRLNAPLSQLIRELPPEQKRRIITSLDANTLMRTQYAADILGHDQSLTEGLLRDEVVDVEILMRALSGYRDATVEALAPILVNAGVPADVIARGALRIRETVGSVSQSIRADILFFAELAERRPELSGVCEVASGKLKVELDEAEAAERMDRLHGW